jgi:hypothetical protein
LLQQASPPLEERRVEAVPRRAQGVLDMAALPVKRRAEHHPV